MPQNAASPAHEHPGAVTIVTLALDAESQEHFEALRQRYFPAALNRIAAHLTLFHALPATEDIHNVLKEEAETLRAFSLEVSGVRTLGRGVAYFMESPELKALHRRLAGAFAEHLSAQDRQGFRPHVVVQNKVDPHSAKLLHAELSAGFRRWEVAAEGLDWWNYLGGPWQLRKRFRFAQT